MSAAPGWSLQAADANNRAELRTHRRYPIALALQYRWNRGSKHSQFGSGTTINISSGGVLFHSGELLPVTCPIELALSWPISLEDCNLKLVLRGRVVRSVSQTTAVRIVQYEFRTAGGRRRLTIPGYPAT